MVVTLEVTEEVMLIWKMKKSPNTDLRIVFQLYGFQSVSLELYLSFYSRSLVSYIYKANSEFPMIMNCYLMSKYMYLY